MSSQTQPVAGEKFNYASHLFAVNQSRGSKAAYIDDQGEMSFAELEDRSRRLASILRESGIRREERVLTVNA